MILLFGCQLERVFCALPDRIFSRDPESVDASDVNNPLDRLMITRTRPKCFAGCQGFALSELPKRCIARDLSNRFGDPLWDEQPKRKKIPILGINDDINPLLNQITLHKANFCH